MTKQNNDYEEYKRECNKIRQENEQLLNDFSAWLAKANLKDKTINNHLQNVDLYINEYLLYEEPIEAKDGCEDIDMFLGYWFIKKCTWASGAQIKATAASLKKFYTFLQQKELIEKNELQELKETIKEGIPEWLTNLKRYDDPYL